MSEKRKSGTFMGDCTVVTSTLVVLKVTHHTNLGWWSVFAPVLLALSLLFVGGMFLGLLDILAGRRERKERQEWEFAESVVSREAARRAQRLREASFQDRPNHTFTKVERLDRPDHRRNRY